VTRPLLLFAPGAGAPSTSAWMTAWAERLAPLGDVVRFDYPYMKVRVETGKRRPPDKLPVLVAAHAAALAAARAARRPVLLVGKSMGSRVGCHLSLALGGDRPVDGLVCFGYPLVGTNGARREEVLVALRTPVLFLQGTRDELCPLELLAEVRTRMTAPSTLHVVEDGDHDLAARKKVTGRTQAEVDAGVLAAVTAFVLQRAAVTGDGQVAAPKSAPSP
jgi:predicted alpha/beta-hydrolase family hydrolase